jgi:hypothetical protein
MVDCKLRPLIHRFGPFLFKQHHLERLSRLDAGQNTTHSHSEPNIRCRNRNSTFFCVFIHDAGNIEGPLYDETRRIKPRYTLAFDSDECYGPAPFAPVYYSRWLASTPGVLYVVNSIALSKR